MDRVREDGHAVGPQSPKDLDKGESQVQEEGCADVSRGFVFVIMRHSSCQTSTGAVPPEC